jgi:hypothetical protein
MPKHPDDPWIIGDFDVLLMPRFGRHFYFPPSVRSAPHFSASFSHTWRQTSSTNASSALPSSPNSSRSELPILQPTSNVPAARPISPKSAQMSYSGGRLPIFSASATMPESTDSRGVIVALPLAESSSRSLATVVSSTELSVSVLPLNTAGLASRSRVDGGAADPASQCFPFRSVIVDFCDFFARAAELAPRPSFACFFVKHIRGSCVRDRRQSATCDHRHDDEQRTPGKPISMATRAHLNDHTTAGSDRSNTLRYRSNGPHRSPRFRQWCRETS